MFLHIKTVSHRLNLLAFYQILDVCHVCKQDSGKKDIDTLLRQVYECCEDRHRRCRCGANTSLATSVVTEWPPVVLLQLVRCVRLALRSYFMHISAAVTASRVSVFHVMKCHGFTQFFFLMICTAFFEIYFEIHFLAPRSVRPVRVSVTVIALSLSAVAVRSVSSCCCFCCRHAIAFRWVYCCK